MSDWKNVQYKDGKMRTSSDGGGGSSTFAGLEDVSFSDLQNGQVPKYNSTTHKWENANESGGGGTVTDVQVDGASVVNPQGVAEIETPNAGGIEYDNQQSGLSATDVQSAIDELAQGSGGGSLTMLSNATITSLNTPANLADDITNYDLILVHAYYTGGAGYPLVATQAFAPSQLITHNRQTWLVGGNADRMLQIEFTTNTTIKITNSNGGNGIQGIYGIKFYGNSNNDRHDYSTVEKIVGTWIDGKPIYEKTISPLTTTSGAYALDVSALHINEIIDFHIFMHNATGGDYAFGSYWQDQQDKLGWYFQSNKNNIIIRSGSGYAYGTGWCVIQYTKITDV